MKIAQPPRHTPVSMKSPGTWSSITLSTQWRTLSRRFRPIIVSPENGTPPVVEAVRYERWRNVDPAGQFVALEGQQALASVTQP